MLSVPCMNRPYAYEYEFKMFVYLFSKLKFCHDIFTFYAHRNLYVKLFNVHTEHNNNNEKKTAPTTARVMVGFLFENYFVGMF